MADLKISELSEETSPASADVFAIAVDLASTPATKKVTLANLINAIVGGSSGHVQFNAGGSFGGDNALFWDNSNKRLGIGMTSPRAKLDVVSDSAEKWLYASSSQTATSGTQFAGRVYVTGNPGGASTANIRGLTIETRHNGANNSTGYVAGLWGTGYVIGPSTLTWGRGIVGQVAVNDASGVMTHGASFYAESPYIGAGTLTNTYGVYIPARGSGTNRWGIYQETDDNYFGGNVGIGTTSPTISDGVGLHLAGKILRIGTSKTPASAGAAGNAGEICWDADYLYVCVATNTWKKVGISTW